MWEGIPDWRRVFSPADFYLVPISVMWGGFAVFWELSVLLWASGANAAFALWGIPFVVIGQYFIWGRFIYRRRQRRATAYALTEFRAIVVRLTLRGTERVEATFLDQVPAINLRRRRDGTGTVEFGSASGMAGWINGYRNAGMGWLTPASGRAFPAFEDVPDVDAVYEMAVRYRAAIFGFSSPFHG